MLILTYELFPNAKVFSNYSVQNITAPSGLGKFVARMNRFTDVTHRHLDERMKYRTTDTLFIMVQYV